MSRWHGLWPTSCWGNEEQTVRSLTFGNSSPSKPSLLHFFEQYRNTLAIYTGISGAVQAPNDQTEAIFSTKNNKQTVNRLLGLYQTLDKLMLSASLATSWTIGMAQYTRKVAAAVVGLSRHHG